MAHTASVE